MKNTYFNLQAFFIALCLTLIISNKGYSTNVSGGIFANTTWTKANSPYIITDTVVIFAGVTVTIEPGVVVEFDPLAEIDQRGNLYAHGTSSDSIIFTSGSAKPFAGIYEGIDISSAINTPADSFICCRFSYANAAINITTGIGSSFPISHCSFFSNLTGISGFFNARLIDNCVFKYDSIGMDQTGSPFESLITGCKFMNNGIALSFPGDSVLNCTFYNNNTGITGISGQGLIKNCIIDSNKICGVNTGDGLVTNCTIRYNGIGISSEEGKIISNDISYNSIGIVSNMDNEISCNSICNNTKYNIEANSSTNESISGNYWCLTDSVNIRATIYDGHQNTNLGLIYFSPFLTTPCINTSPCKGGIANTVRDTICIGTPGNLTLSGSAGSIQWQSSIDDINFADITGATKTTYKTVPLLQTTWYRTKVDSGSCSSFSDTAQMYVPAPIIPNCSSTQTGPNQVTFNSDSSAGSIRSYHWDFGDNNTSNAADPVHTYASDTSYYVCLTLYDGSNCSYTCCRYVTVTSQTPQGGQISPAYSIICSGGTKTLRAADPAGNNFQWQISPDNTTWANINGAYDTTYTTASADGNTNKFYRLTNQSGIVLSTTAEVDVSQPTVTIMDTSIGGTILLVWSPRGLGNYILTYGGPSSGSLSGITPPATLSGLTNGTYNIEVTQTGVTGGCSASGSKVVVVSNASCKLTPWFNYSTGTNGIATFTGFAVDSMVGAHIVSWHWNFGDGDTSNAQNPIHSYALGSYTVCLTVTNSLGCSNQYCQQIKITSGGGCHLTAQFSYTLNDSSGLAIFRDLSADTTQGVSINSWSWNFNTFNGTSVLQNPSFTFPVDSNYYVCLTVTNSIGCSSNSCQYILVHKVTGPCNITPQYSYTSDATGLGSFVDLSSDSSGIIDSWHWNFGDLGSPSDDSYVQNPTHAFTTSSIYNVCLTAGNTLGCNNTICKQVPITSTISSLCVSVFPQDSNLITQTGQQSEEYYLIKEFNTANGDSLALVDTFTINSSLNTAHCFTNLANGTYYVKAAFMPGSTQYSNYLPSYYNGVLLWDNATPLNLNGSQFISLMLLKGTNSGGPGFIGGYVSQGANRLEQGASTNAVGDPEPGKTVILTTGNGDAVAHTLTDTQGHFQFSNLAFGIYYLAVDELNKPCTPLEVTIDDSTGYHENANFQMNNKSISSQIALSTYTITQHPFAVSLAGNPVGHELALHLQNMSSDAIISITDLLGRELLTNNAPQQSTTVKINVQSLASGVYLLTVNSGSDVKTIKFVKE